MSILKTLAQEVIKNWQTGDLAEAVRKLDDYLKEEEKDRSENQTAIAAARKRYVNDDLEIDDEPDVAIGGVGVWVQAWVWVEGEGA